MWHSNWCFYAVSFSDWQIPDPTDSKQKNRNGCRLSILPIPIPQPRNDILTSSVFESTAVIAKYFKRVTIGGCGNIVYLSVFFRGNSDLSLPQNWHHNIFWHLLSSLAVITRAAAIILRYISTANEFLVCLSIYYFTKIIIVAAYKYWLSLSSNLPLIILCDKSWQLFILSALNKIKQIVISTNEFKTCSLQNIFYLLKGSLE